MSDVSLLFDKMRDSKMNDWVGGSDPELVGRNQAAMIRSMINFDENSKVLDFGCGIGRTIAAICDGYRPAELLGLDIMPPVVEFCRKNVQPVVRNCSFETVVDYNDHYDHLKGAGTSKTKSEILERYHGRFNVGYALSVFTHVAADDMVELLKFVSNLLEPGGQFLFTCFSLTPYSRYMIENAQSIFPLDQKSWRNDGGVLIGNVSDPLAFIAFDRCDIERMAWEAGLAVTKQEYGVWMGGQLGSWLQDAVVCRKPLALKAAEDIEMTAVVARS